jgi:hypothetical protein
VARTKPGLEPLALTVAVVWIAFVAASWLADPIANVLLRFHPVGRHALAREAQREAAIVAALLLVAGANVGCLFLGGGLVFVVAAAVSAALVLPVVAFHQRERGTRMRLAFGIWGALLALVGAVAIGCLAAAPARDHDHPAFLAGLLAAGAFLLGAIATTWASAGVRVLESRSRG